MLGIKVSYPVSTFTRTLLPLADAAAHRTALDAQQLAPYLTSLSGLGTATGLVRKGAGNSASVQPTSLVVDTFLGAASKEEALTILGLVPGTDIQPYDAELAAIAALTGEGLVALTGPGTATTRTTGTTGLSVLAAADAATAQSALGLVPGTHIQPVDADLTALAALTTTGLIDRTGDGTATTRTTGTTGLNVLAAATQADALTAIGAQPLDSDLTALAGLTTTGLIDRTGDGTATTRTAGTTGLALLATATPAEALAAIGAASRNSILAAYNFAFWNPANLAFAVTPAPSTGTQIDNDYVTFSNVGGLLTITLDVAGSYFFSVCAGSYHGASFSAARIRVVIGGTATSGYNFDNNALPSWNVSSTFSFSADVTAGQTVTVRPTYEVTGSGTAGNHTALCFVNILYCGS